MAVDMTVTDAIAERAALGFPSDREYVKSLMDSPADVGSREYGIVMTPAEVEEFLERTTFADQASSSVLNWARSLDVYGGAYIDHIRGGGLIILVTESPDDLLAEVRARAKGLTRFIEVRTTKHSLKELRAGAERVWEVWSDVADDVPLLGVAVDEAAGRLRVDVPAGRFDAVQMKVLTDLIGLPVATGSGTPPVDVDCTGRSNCWEPIHAGIKVHRGDPAETWCTMGFMIVRSGDDLWLTSGHCGFTGSNDWHHPGYGELGNELANLLRQNGYDLMRVQMPNDQDSPRVYMTSTTWKVVGGARNPILNEAVCASMGNTNTYDCGTVADATISWTSSTCQCTVWGGDAAGMTANPGDSGSPLSSNPATGRVQAIGIIANTNENFAWVTDALSIWDASIRTP